MLQPNSNTTMPRPRATFVMEQQLGHATYYQNLRSHFDGNSQLQINWIKALYQPAGTIWEKVPGIPHRTRNILSAHSRVASGLRDQPWDVAFFNTHVPARMAGRLRNRGPYVVTSDITPMLHDTMSEAYGRPVETNPLLRRYKHWLHSSMFQGAERLLPWSNWVRDSLIGDYGVDPQKIEVIPPGVDLDQWKPAPDRTPAQEGDKSPVRLLFVGGDFYRKGGALLLRAFAQLPQDQACLDIVTRESIDPADLGDGQNIRVHHGLGPNAPELLALYQSSDIFVFPTQAEAFGIVAAEASASGLPVIASDVGGLSDIVVQGETGFLFGRDDEAQLAAHLRHLLGDSELRIKMGRAGRERAEKLFDATRNADRILQIVREVAL